MTLVPISSNQGQMLFTWRVVKHWNRLLRETVKSPSLEIFAAQLGVRLSKLMKCGCCTAVSRAEAMRDPFLPRLLHQCIISMPVQFVLIQSPFFFFSLIFLFSPSEELIKGLKVREILLAHLMGIVFLISAFLFVFLQKFCSSYFSLKQLKSLSKPSECLVPTVFLLHSGKCTASQTISIPVCFIP